MTATGLEGVTHLTVHTPHEHPERAGEFRWFMAPSGMVYWLAWWGWPGRGWEVFTHTGGTVRDGFRTLAHVRDWALDGEELP